MNPIRIARPSDWWSRVGRCPRCMRTSFASTAIALMALLAVLPTRIVPLTAAAAAAFTILGALSLVHALAYLVRKPLQQPCSSCERRRRAAARRHAWQNLQGRLRSWVGAPAQQPPRTGRCLTCGMRTPLEQMDHQPAADPGMRAVVERSPQFALVAQRLAQRDPVDSWEADMLHYHVYQLAPAADGGSVHAVFVTRWEDDLPVGASLMTQRSDGGPPDVLDLNAMLSRPPVRQPAERAVA